MGASPRVGLDPTIMETRVPLPAQGAIGKVREAKNWARSRFVDTQLYPKAGVVGVLMEQGMDGVTAARWAEKGYGGAGIVQGGIETPGILKLAETLNRTGIAMFTSYPLHSMNRILQLMTTNPNVAMQFPILRHYLVNQSSPEMQEEVQQGKLRATEVPLGGLLRNPDGTDAAVEMGAFVPHGGAFQFGQMFSDPMNVFSPIQQFAQQAEYIGRSGLNPVDAGAQKQKAAVRAIAPGIVSRGMNLEAALNRQPPTAYATQPQSVPQALSGLIAPVRDISSSLERRLDPTKVTNFKESRRKFMGDYQVATLEGRETGKDLTHHPALKHKDEGVLMGMEAAAQGVLRNLLSDDRVTDKEAFRMIRHQWDYIRSIWTVIDRQRPGFAAAQMKAHDIIQGDQDAKQAY
jgi:hypothetical protein